MAHVFAALIASAATLVGMVVLHPVGSVNHASSSSSDQTEASFVVVDICWVGC